MSSDAGRSAFDRLMAGIDALPGHGWWLYPLLVVAQIAWQHLWVWGLGLQPVGTL